MIVAPFDRPLTMSLADHLALAAWYAHKNTEGSWTHIGALQAGEPEDGRNLNTEPYSTLDPKLARAIDSHPYKVALGSCCCSSVDDNDTAPRSLGMLSAPEKACGDPACFRRLRRSMRCWTREIDAQQNQCCRIQPEVTSPRKTSLPAVDRPAISDAQTEVRTTDCRSLGLDILMTVAAPDLRSMRAIRCLLAVAEQLVWCRLLRD